MSGELELLVGRALASDPSGRQATAVELARALDAAVSHQSGEGPARTLPGSPPAPRSIAVLPFVNMSADPENEYFSDGMTEELISVLTKMGGLQVAARSSVFAYKGKSEDARIIGRTLNVDTVLAGSVRKAGRRIRLAAQLTSVADGYQVWADTFDRELSDVFAVQDEISQAIARALQVRLVPGAGPAAGRQGTDDVEAYTLYLRGRFHWGRRTESEIRKGLEHFQQALARDPGYALAEIGVADSYNIMGFYDWLHPRGSLSRARWPRPTAPWRWTIPWPPPTAPGRMSGCITSGSGRRRRRTSAVPSTWRRSTPRGRTTTATCWSSRAASSEAEAAMQQAVTSEPLSLICQRRHRVGGLLRPPVGLGNFPSRNTIELDPSFMVGHLWLGNLLVQSGETDESVREYEAAVRLSGRTAIAVAGLARAHAAAGRRGSRTGW